MSNGICTYNVIAQRAESSHKSEMVNQLLFGDIYEVLEASPDQKWYKIRTLFDNYEGYIDAKLHHAVTDYHPNAMTQEVGMLTTPLSKIIVPAGCFLHTNGAKQVLLLDQAYTFQGAYVGLNKNNDFQKLKTNAFQYLGTPYLWGGKSHFGIDCSGLTQQVYKMSGIQILRDAYQQATQGEEILFENQKPGDLAFFGESGKITHVGIVLERGELIHAHGEVRIDVLDNKGILNKKINAYSHTLLKIKRIFSEAPL